MGLGVWAQPGTEQEPSHGVRNRGTSPIKEEQGHMEHHKISVIVPCLNEEHSIGKVVRDLASALPEAEIVVIDNGSSDNSRQEAREAGATVIHEPRRGKGYVVRLAFRAIDSDIYVLLDGDDTYPANRVEDLIAPLIRGETDMVVGSRLEMHQDGAFTSLHLLGNKMITATVNVFFGTRLTDVLSGYRAMRRELVRNVPLLSKGFEVECELSLQAAKYGYTVQEIPIAYRSRALGTESKLRTFRDGLLILTTLAFLLRDHRPLFFFGIASLACLTAGLVFGTIVVENYLRTGLVARLPLGVVAVGLILLGSILFMTGFVTSATNRRIEEISSILRRR